MTGRRYMIDASPSIPLLTLSFDCPPGRYTAPDTFVRSPDPPIAMVLDTPAIPMSNCVGDVGLRLLHRARRPAPTMIENTCGNRYRRASALVMFGCVPYVPVIDRKPIPIALARSKTSTPLLEPVAVETVLATSNEGSRVIMNLLTLNCRRG